MHELHEPHIKDKECGEIKTPHFCFTSESYFRYVRAFINLPVFLKHPQILDDVYL